MEISSIYMVDARAGWSLAAKSWFAGQGDHVLRTQDGGQTWLDVTPPEEDPTADEFDKAAIAFFLGMDTAWVTYVSNRPYRSFITSPTVWMTHDGVSRGRAPRYRRTASRVAGTSGTSCHSISPMIRPDGFSATWTGHLMSEIT